MRIFTNPKRHTVIITENQMNKINESSSDVETYYRACSRDEAEGKFKLFSLWLTPDDFYAKEYLDNEPNKVIVEYKIDENLLNPASIYEMDEILGEEIDVYNPSEEKLKTIYANGYNCFYLEYDSYNATGLCLFDTKPIISKRILSDKEVENITEAIKVSTAEEPDANTHTTQTDFKKFKKCPKCGAQMPFLMSIYDEHDDNDDRLIGRCDAEGNWDTAEYQAFGIWQCPKCFHTEAESNMS